MIIEDYNSFYSLCTHFKHQKSAKEVYEKLPFNIKEKIEQKHVMICDYVLHSKYPNKRINGMPIGIFHKNSKLIDLIPEETIRLSENGLKGIIVHEVAHFYVESLSPLIRKLKGFLFFLKFKKIPIDWQKFYGKSEEFHADWIACKWGFTKEIEIMNKERCFKLENEK